VLSITHSDFTIVLYGFVAFFAAAAILALKFVRRCASGYATT
jgi:hypothetical protein